MIVNRRFNEQRYAQGNQYNGRKCHYVIGGLDGIGHMTISVGIFVIGNESIG